MENFAAGISVGMGCWMFVWGLNRAYLMFKNLIS